MYIIANKIFRSLAEGKVYKNKKDAQKQCNEFNKGCEPDDIGYKVYKIEVK